MGRAQIRKARGAGWMGRNDGADRLYDPQKAPLDVLPRGRRTTAKKADRLPGWITDKELIRNRNQQGYGLDSLGLGPEHMLLPTRFNPSAKLDTSSFVDQRDPRMTQEEIAATLQRYDAERKAARDEGFFNPMRIPEAIGSVLGMMKPSLAQGLESLKRFDDGPDRRPLSSRVARRTTGKKKNKIRAATRRPVY